MMPLSPFQGVRFALVADPGDAQFGLHEQSVLCPSLHRTSADERGSVWPAGRARQLAIPTGARDLEAV